ncbi:MAG: VWA domain-containing protein, partial [Acidobacteria bacterium]|nr:VWA domain-containing protein [Acidobacteriota bacterium]
MSTTLCQRRPSLVALALAMLTLESPAAGVPSPGGDAAVESDFSEKLRFAQVERVQLVLVPATVTDKKGRPVLNLTRDDFMLFDEDQPREIEFFASESEAPIALAFLLDVSGSMRQPGKLDSAKSAIGSFLDVLGMKDRFGLICFADSQVAWVTPFTSDAVMFRLRLGVQEAYGQTALYDALAATP